MRILFTNLLLAGGTGTEMYLRDLTLGLIARGHEVSIFTPRPGALGQVLEAAGVRVVTDPLALPAPPELIHGHHAEETLLAVAAWPGVPALFLLHDAVAWHDEPPRHLRLLRHYAVDEACRDRILQAGLACAGLLPNAVDLARFPRRPPLPLRPRRALVFSNYARDGNHLEPIRTACARAGLDLTVVGAGVGSATLNPEAILGDYDLVFAKARCALEAMATGCAVVLCDVAGLGGLVSPGRLAALRPLNFGRRALTEAVTAERLLEAINAYAPDQAAAVSDWVRREADLEALLDRVEAAHRELLAAWRAAPSAEGESPAWEVGLQLKHLAALRREAEAPITNVKAWHQARRLAGLLRLAAALLAILLGGLALAGHWGWALLGLVAGGILGSRIVRRWRRMVRAF